MTDTALKPIDTTPLAFEAHLTDTVRGTADHGVKFSVRSKGEVSTEDFLRLCELARAKQLGFNVFVPDATSAEDITMPPRPGPKAIEAKRKFSACQLQRLKLEDIARENGHDTPEQIEAFYQKRMAMNLAKLQAELEDLRAS